ncbi:MAG: extracellular solute-binding protein [Pirellulaceae bacterium]|nr:extracellular solute-binding protein [Pirellulaceae bacterium]
MSIPLHPATIVLALAALSVAGCATQSAAPPVSPPAAGGEAAPLRVLVVDDAPLAQAIGREWKSRTETSLAIQNIDLARLLSAKRLPADVVVFPAGQVGELAERGLIEPLPETTLDRPDFDRRDIFPLVRLRGIVWGERTCAVPLGMPQLLLAYRADLLEKAGLAPPRTWAEFAKVAAALADRSTLGELAPPEGEPWQAAIAPLAPGWAGQSLLARAAAAATHRDQLSPLFHYETLEPLVAGPPFVRALEEVVAANQGELAKRRLTPAEALDELSRGHAALALTWLPARPASGATLGHALRFAPLPGSDDCYNAASQAWENRAADEPARVPLLAVAGRLAAVTTSAASPTEAHNFVLWLAGPRVSLAIAPHSAWTAPVRQSHLSDGGQWASQVEAASFQSYGEALAESAALPRPLTLALPGRQRYLAALDVAVEQALAAEKSPAEGLAAAAEKWREITADIGVAKQKQALRRELGIEPLP